METYRTISGSADSEIEVKRSRFLSHIEFADTEERALEVLNAIRAKHRTASHNVYAYLLRDGGRTRYSDDGEPAKTAGEPTLEAIRHAGLLDCVLVTTRYFGGTLLGTGGLVRAYTASAAAAIEAARVVTMCLCVRGEWCVDYALYEQAARLLAGLDARCDAPEFADRVRLSFLMRSGVERELEPKAQELCRGGAKICFSEPFYAPF